MAKFRVWSKKENKFIQDERSLFLNEKGELFEKNYADWGASISLDRLKDDDYVVEQCVKINKELFYSKNSEDNVLKDVEFYEGDIIKMHFFYDDHDPISLGWVEGEKEVIGILKCENLGGAVIVSKNKEYSYSLLQDPLEELEKLGDIHQNKESL